MYMGSRRWSCTCTSVSVRRRGGCGVQGGVVAAAVAVYSETLSGTPSAHATTTEVAREATEK